MLSQQTAPKHSLYALSENQPSVGMCCIAALQILVQKKILFFLFYRYKMRSVAGRHINVHQWQSARFESKVLRPLDICQRKYGMDANSQIGVIVIVTLIIFVTTLYRMKFQQKFVTSTWINAKLVKQRCSFHRSMTNSYWFHVTNDLGDDS